MGLASVTDSFQSSQCRVHVSLACGRTDLGSVNTTRPLCWTGMKRHSAKIIIPVMAASKACQGEASFRTYNVDTARIPCSSIERGWIFYVRDHDWWKRMENGRKRPPLSVMTMIFILWGGHSAPTCRGDLFFMSVAFIPYTGEKGLIVVEDTRGARFYNTPLNYSCM